MGDYINANFINGEVKGSERAYIATQGCLKATVPHFWQMIWDQNVRVIVMTTAVVERGKNKCAPYWSTAEGGPVLHGRFIVEPIAETETGAYILRRMNLKHGKHPPREIFQYQYKGWPDHGVPD